MAAGVCVKAGSARLWCVFRYFQAGSVNILGKLFAPTRTKGAVEKRAGRCTTQQNLVGERSDVFATEKL